MPDRPRDALGRPLPRDAPDPFPGVIVRLDITGAEAVAEAGNYLERGLPFHAHEILEMRWRTCPPDERGLWRGLAQAAAAHTHAARGNPIGAERLLQRGRSNVEDYAGPVDAALAHLIARLLATPGEEALAL